MNIQLLMTGNELMLGDIVDSNSAMIAKVFKQLGLNITRKVTLADDYNLLVHEILDISQQADVLIINGGLGPTIDDLTAQALAQAANINIATHPVALRHLKSWAKLRNQVLAQANLKQAELPENCEIIPNSNGSAVGFSLNLNACQIYCTPGVPSELAPMLTQQIAPKFLKNNNQFLEIKRYSVFGIGESNLQELLNHHFSDWPNAIELGFRAASPLLELKLTLNDEFHRPTLVDLSKKVEKLLGGHIIEKITTQPKPMAELVLDLLQDKKKTITLAESCTGGLIASLLTEIPGSSASFEAGFVTYSNKMKEHLVNVKHSTLTEFGAVSEQVVKEMALGALIKTNADYTIAVSGIAGPTGGTAEKPVGTVWMAWGNRADLRTCTMQINGDRKYFQHTVANRALDLIRRFIIRCEVPPHYISTIK